MSAGNDVLDQHGAGPRSVALPELLAAGAVVSYEIQLAVVLDQIAGIRRAGTGVDVFDQRGALRRAVRLPQFPAARGVFGDEESDVAHLDELRRLGGAGRIQVDQLRTD